MLYICNKLSVIRKSKGLERNTLHKVSTFVESNKGVVVEEKKYLFGLNKFRSSTSNYREFLYIINTNYGNKQIPSIQGIYIIS